MWLERVAREFVIYKLAKFLTYTLAGQGNISFDGNNINDVNKNDKKEVND